MEVAGQGDSDGSKVNTDVNVGVACKTPLVAPTYSQNQKDLNLIGWNKFIKF